MRGRRTGEHRRALHETADADLVERSRAGDVDAFGELWRRHYRSGIAVARSVTDSLDPDDLVQEAYTRIFRSIQRGGGPTGSFRAYLFSSIRNTAAGWGRARTEGAIDELDSVPDPATDEQAVSDALDRGLTHQAFRSLPTRWQEVLWYCEIEQMKPAEIAPLLGMKANAVAQLAVRAREGLRQAWVQAHLRSVADGSPCQWTIERLGAYSRGGLGKRDRAKVDRHLHDCARCAIVAAEAKDVSDRLALVLLPLVLGTGAAGYATWLQLGAPVTAVAAMPSAVVEGAVLAGMPGVAAAGAAGAGSGGAFAGAAGSGGASSGTALAGAGAAGSGAAGPGGTAAGAGSAGTASGGVFAGAGAMAGLATAGVLVAATVAVAAVVIPRALMDAPSAPTAQQQQQYGAAPAPALGVADVEGDGSAPTPDPILPGTPPASPPVTDPEPPVAHPAPPATDATPPATAEVAPPPAPSGRPDPAPAPGDPGADPADPGATGPEDPGTTEPTDPTDPGTQPEVPTDPGTDPTEPTDPGTTGPSDPGTTAPPDAGTDPTDPADPGTTEPTDPGTGPDDPGTDPDPGTTNPDPGHPSVTDPDNPEPTDPEPTDPGDPGATDPTNPEPTDPGNPTDPGTTDPGTTDPDPGTTDPGTTDPAPPVQVPLAFGESGGGLDGATWVVSVTITGTPGSDVVVRLGDRGPSTISLNSQGVGHIELHPTLAEILDDAAITVSYPGIDSSTITSSVLALSGLSADQAQAVAAEKP
ncbi:sigma-70 family RNA polymerase sigma factor [Microbacterium luticocti]|uniref:sigma-70 family RNA polymerase sigma factor n=1 Tax=Microbacterium luticocti TaxID=451764 RepID=UPI00040F257E|nr:sigma-70 family RNA polymerase sigma factor [Microbacterium luticocti]